MPSVIWVVAAAVAEALVGLLLCRDLQALGYRRGDEVGLPRPARSCGFPWPVRLLLLVGHVRAHKGYPTSVTASSAGGDAVAQGVRWVLEQVHQAGGRLLLYVPGRQNVEYKPLLTRLSNTRGVVTATWPVQVAALVGDALDPVAGVTTNGHRSLTLWGEMAAQLGDDAFAAMTANDDARSAPGTHTILQAFGQKPTIVIIDEIAQYLRQVTSSGDENVRRTALVIPVFLKNLFEVAADPSNRSVSS